MRDKIAGLIYIMISVAIVGSSVTVFAKDACETEVENPAQIDPSKFMVNEGFLTITYDGVIRWKDKIVDLHAYAPRRKVLMRLLLALIDRHGELVPTRELFDDAWVESDTGQPPAVAVWSAVDSIIQHFKAVDSSFDMIYRVFGAGYSWVREEDRRLKKFGKAGIIAATQSFYWKEKEIHLSPGEFNIIQKFLISPGQTFSFIELYEAFSGESYDENRDDFDTIRIITTVISHIRAKIIIADPEFDSIKTIKGIGYGWSNGEHAKEIRIGRLTLLPGFFEVQWDNRKIKVSPGRYRMIEELAMHPGRHIGWESLYLRFANTNLVQRDPDKIIGLIKTEVSKIRNAFKEVDKEFSQIKPARAVGFYWQK